MGKTFEVVVDFLKVGGYLATGGLCFYLLSGGSLPFRTKGNNDNSAAVEGHYAMPALSPTTSERLAAQQNLESQYNSMANNKTNIAKRDEKTATATATGTTTTTTTAPNEERSNDAGNNECVRAETALRQCLSSGKPLCGGLFAELPSDYLTKMRQVEERRQAALAQAEAK